MGARDGFAEGHRVSRVLAIGVPLAIFLVWWGWNGGARKLKVATEVSGTVIRDDGKTGLVRAQSGEEARVVMPGKLESGAVVRLRRNEFDNGDLRFDLLASTPVSQ
jgi:hypothetical protein